MGLPRHIAGALASAAARRRNGRDALTAIGKTFVAILSSDMRGPLVKRKAETREGAFAMARRLLDDAERQQFSRGEVVSVQIGQADA